VSFDAKILFMKNWVVEVDGFAGDAGSFYAEDVSSSDCGFYGPGVCSCSKKSMS
jgi:hypothetical protein